MTTIKRILCPIDYSEYSRHALDHALAIARWYGGSITALHVVAPVIPAVPAHALAVYPPVAFTADDLERCRANTVAFVEEGGGGAPIDCVVVEGYVTPEIVQLARDLPADLIVMGSHGRSGFDRLMLGSVTERVLRKAPCPVLTVPRRTPEEVPTGPVLFRRILCAIDFSPSSLKALAYAASLAEHADARLTAMHVLEHVPSFEPVVVGVPGELEYSQLARAGCEKRLHASVAERLGTNFQASEVVTTGKPYQEILRVAHEQQSDLIAIGVHGGVAGLLAFGSTTNHVVRQATCPVLSLKA
jgi:nucleotide-binding universal stress UspA family protein